MKTIDHPVTKEREQEAELAVRDAQGVAAFVEGVAVVDVASAEVATETIIEIRKQRAALAERKDLIAVPLREALREVDELFAPALKGYDLAEEILKGRVLSLRAQQRAARHNALLQVASAPTPEEKTLHLGIAERAREGYPEKLAGLRFSQKARGELLDINLLPEGFVVRTPNQKALDAATKESGGDPGIPGWRGWIDESAAVYVGDRK